jgi:hypothetical protein
VGSIALKEWAVVVHALLAGEQILDLRKGGLHEEQRRFDVRTDRFWLYPTTEHQRPELVKPAYRRWITEAVDAGPLRVEGWAEVAGVATITDPDVLATLDAKFVWTRAYAETRLQWKQRQPLWIIALRAFRLVEPLEIPMRAGYSGCASWVELDDVPADPSALASEPALSDESFAARLQLCADAIPGGLATPVA